jgi:glucose-6-phosphate 1-dehydrogenase
MADACRPVTMVVFGASGDLTGRKLIPALYANYVKGRLPDCPAVVGFARRPWNDEEFRNHLRTPAAEALGGAFDASVWEGFSRRLRYFRGQLDSTESYPALNDFLGTLEGGPADRLYYLATAPEFFPPIVEFLGR